MFWEISRSKGSVHPKKCSWNHTKGFLFKSKNSKQNIFLKIENQITRISFFDLNIPFKIGIDFLKYLVHLTLGLDFLKTFIST